MELNIKGLENRTDYSRIIMWTIFSQVNLYQNLT